MKKSNLKIFLIGLVALASSMLQAQTSVNMALNGATGTFSIAPTTTCAINFYDSGGPSNDYNNSADAYVTFLPSNSATHRIQAQFLSMGLEADRDAFYIYNSNTLGVNQVVGPQGATSSGFPAGNWQNINPGTVTANTGIAAAGPNAAEALTFQFRSDASIAAAGWQAVVRQIPIISCSMTAPAPQTAFTGLGSSSCTAMVTTPIPTFSPGGCQVGYQLQYRINGGTPTIVADPVNTNITLPVGINIVTWELVDPCGSGVITSANQTVTVTDNSFPQITCPGNTTINLGPGECSRTFDYNISCADNCGFLSNRQVITPIDFNDGQAGVMFDLVNLGSTPITITQFGPSLDAGTWPIEVYVTTAATTWQGNQNNAGAWTIAGAINVTSTTPSSGTAVPGFGITIPAGQSRGIYITSSTGSPINYTTGTRSNDDTILRIASAPGAGVAYPFGTTSSSRAYNGFVRYATNLTQAPVQLSGLPSGQTYPIGTTTNVFRCTDASGNTSTCSFTVTVLEYPTPTWALNCNDLVSVSIGDDCQLTLTPDDILEGGPYRCFDNYDIRIDKIAPFGNGPWVLPNLGAADIGKTYTVRITEPLTGNSCSGNVKVLDGRPPELVCPAPVTIPCNLSESPTDTRASTLRLSYAVPLADLPVIVRDNESKTFDIPVLSSPGVRVRDLDLRTIIGGDAFNNNLRIEVKSPAGTTVRVFDQQGGCGPSDLNVRFDDEGSTVLSCVNFTTGANVKMPGVNLGSFDNEIAYGIWKVIVTDVNGGSDISSVKEVELFMSLNGVFGAGFPNNVQPNQVTTTGLNTYSVPAGLIDACTKVTLSYFDTRVNQNCGSPYTAIITRVWTAVDESGNSSTCAQTINLLRPTHSDVQFPPNYDDFDEPSIMCEFDEYPSPDWLEGQGLQGWPTTFSLPDNCQINWTYEDQVVPICDGSYDVLRTWTVADPCNATKLSKHLQIIHIRDEDGPTFLECPSNIVESTDPFKCCATINLPDVLVEDNCSRVDGMTAQIHTLDPYTGDTIKTYSIIGGLTTFPGNNPSDPDTLATFGNTPCLPIGDHIVVYFSQDNCGNTSTCSFRLTVKDYAPPQPSCDEETVVAIGIDNPLDCYYPSANGCEFPGVTWVQATTFDDGSYDECSPIKFTIRRQAPYSDCIEGLDKFPCTSNGVTGQSEYDLAIAESDSIKFYCCEVGTTQNVILRVYQLNYDGTIALYQDGTPIFNECNVKVTVQDRLKPVCVPPPNYTVTCESFDPTFWAYGIPQVYDNCCLDAGRIYQNQKGLTHSVNYSQFDSVCNKGTIVRTFRVSDCHNQTSQCTQRIVVNYEQDYFVKFPDDKIITVCDGTGLYGEPTFFGEDCELIGVSYEDQIFTVVPDACFKIERTWKIINWCTYDPQQPCTVVPNPNPNSITNHSTNLPGPIVSAPGTVGIWTPTTVAVTPGASATNFSQFWSPTNNCYTYKQIIKVIDLKAPIIECPASPVEYCDITTNNPQLWNEQYWYEPSIGTHDMADAPTDISVTATDLCSGANLSVRYLLLLDLDSDGTMETVINSVNPPAAGTVNYDNVGTSNYTGGVVRNFDQRPVNANQKYRFGLRTTTTGNTLTASVRWNTLAAQNNFVVPELPYGMHKIKWFIGDGCGNEAVCEYAIIVKDCAAPTVTCRNGLSVNIAPGGTIHIFASDFLLDAYDNYTPDDQLEFAIRKSGIGTGFPLTSGNQPVVSLSFDCSELGTQPIELWGKDKAGRADYCETYLIVQDNVANCDNDMVSVSGALKTEADNGLEECDVEISGHNPAGPAFNYFDMSDHNGNYDFSDAVPVFSNYEVTPTKDDNPLNGITTFDLVLISKHILGIEPLGTPYKMIAADANRSNSITTMDIVELRKLILGVYTELPNNSSWRFVDKAYAFPNPANPFTASIPESKSVASIQGSSAGDDFVAIKVGDINGSAVANSMMVADDRTAGTLIFDVNDREVKAGEIFDVTLKATEHVTGYQFTLGYGDMELVDIVTPDNMSDDNFAVFPDNHTLTTSWNGNGQAEFTLKFRANRTGQISKMLNLSSSVTKAEAYRLGNDNVTAEQLGIALRFNGKEGSVLTGIGFELYQNQPNPFVNRTTIGFHLPEDASARLTVYDETGRLVYSQRGEYTKGYNYFVLDRAMLNSTGTLFYTVETDNDAASRKMIQSK
jgi:hypothetical protein